MVTVMATDMVMDMAIRVTIPPVLLRQKKIRNKVFL
jgi:DNA-binding transcriptional regulator/RsmH inhibitor MraZ